MFKIMMDNILGRMRWYRKATGDIWYHIGWKNFDTGSYNEMWTRRGVWQSDRIIEKEDHQG